MEAKIEHLPPKAIKLVPDIGAGERNEPMKEKISTTSKNTVLFFKRLLGVVFAILAMLPVASAIYSVWFTRVNINGFAAYSLMFSSVIGGFLGLIALYKILMEREARK